MTRAAIEDLVHGYADAVVHRDVTLWQATWTEDATWGLGPGRTVEGRPAIVEAWHEAMAGFDAVIQTVENGTCHLDGETGIGTGRWYVTERFRPVGTGPGLLVAHYDDRYRRVDDGWRFSARYLTIHYLGPPDLSGRWPSAAGGDSGSAGAGGRYETP